MLTPPEAIGAITAAAAALAVAWAGLRRAQPDADRASAEAGDLIVTSASKLVAMKDDTITDLTSRVDQLLRRVATLEMTHRKGQRHQAHLEERIARLEHDKARLEQTLLETRRENACLRRKAARPTNERSTDDATT